MNPDIEKALTELQKKRKNPLLLLDLKQVDGSSVLNIYRKLNNKKFKELDVILQTPGGSPDQAYTIIKLLRRHVEKLNIVVPLYAKSAGTLICLGADKLLMSEIAELGPLDTQIMQSRQGDVNYKSALDGFKALEQIQIHALENLDIAAKLIVEKSGLRILDAISLAIDFSGSTSGCLYNQLDPMAMGEYQRALDIGQRYGYLILAKHMNWDPEKARSVVSHLIYHYPSHGSIIDVEELKELGLPAELLDSNEFEAIESLPVLLMDEEESIIELVGSTAVATRSIVAKKGENNAKK